MKTFALISLMIGCAKTSDDTGTSIDETNDTTDEAYEEAAAGEEEDGAEGEHGPLGPCG